MMTAVLLALLTVLTVTAAEVWPIPGVGKVNGTSHGNVKVFYGIKYGQARRFEQAAAAMPWEDAVLDTTTEAPPCAQHYDGKYIGVEDCLTLDVRTCAPDGSRPVFVWIHGGGLSTGSSAEAEVYNGTSLVEHSDCKMVYVAIQYRLNLFGYLDHPLFRSSNFGIMDQQLALRWVQSYIHNFGGDRTKVTIVGESAGGASVAMHMASPLSRGLFRGAIAESPWTSSVTGNKPRATAQFYGSQCADAACPDTAHNGSKLLNCLQSFHNATTLVSLPQCASYQPFVTVDGHLLTEPVWQSVRNGRLNPVPLIAGSQSGEWEFSAWGGANTTQYALFEFAMERGFNTWNLTILQALEVGAMLDRARLHYPADEHPNTFPGEDGRDTALMTDLLFTCMTDQMTRHHSASNTHRYLFSHTPLFVNDTGLQGDLQRFAYHTLELSYVFKYFQGFPDEHGKLRQTIRKNDLKLSEAMQDYWVAFTLHGEPQSSFGDWPLTSQGEMLEFAPMAQQDYRNIDYHKTQCNAIIKLFDRAFK